MQTKYIQFFSSTRLKSYSSIEEHFKHLFFIQKITPKLLLIELMLRNKVDSFMKEQYGCQDWLVQMEEIKPKLKSLKDYPHLSYDHIISRLSFGAWTTALSVFYENHKDHPPLINLSSISLKNYLIKNTNLTMKPFKQMGVVFDLVKKIRNRAFHLENIYQVKSGYGRYKFCIEMKEMENFLNQVIKSFDEDFYERELKRYFP